MKKIICLLLALIMVMSLTACGQTAAPAPTTAAPTTEAPTDAATEPSTEAPTETPTEPAKEIIYDTQGNEFEVPMQMDRVIVLNSSIYEMIYVLGKDDAVIGVSDSTVSPASALTKDKFGGWKEPNVELILEAAPDAVFGYASWLDSGIAQQITDAGIPVVMLDLYVPNNILNEVEFLGKLLGAEERASAFIADVQEILDMVTERTADVEPLSTYWEGYTDYKSVGKGSGGHELMELANVASLTADQDVAYPEISDEWMLEKNPQMIVKSVSNTKGIIGEDITDPAAVEQLYADICARPGWDSLDAVANGKVLVLSSRICTTPLGLAIAPLFMAKAAYPEKFEDVDADAILNKMLETYWGTSLTGIWSYQK